MDKSVVGFCLELSQDASRNQMALGLAKYNEWFPEEKIRSQQGQIEKISIFSPNKEN